MYIEGWKVQTTIHDIATAATTEKKINDLGSETDVYRNFVINGHQ